jgi:hypothetical protein
VTAERAQRTAERSQRVADIGERNFRISRALGFTFAPVAMLDSLRPITSAAWNVTGADDAHSLPISMCTPGTRVSARCKDPRLRVVPLVDHGVIALRCLVLMNQHLHYNMCGLSDEAVANEDVKSLDKVLCENVSDAMRYAVCFWCTHLTASDSTNGSLLDTLDEFCRRHLFHWVEVLSLVKHVPRAETALLEVIEWCEV